MEGGPHAPTAQGIERTAYHASMDAQPPLVMTFADLDEAESALDWLGVEFADAEGGFIGELATEDRELLDDALADAGTPQPVRDLALALGRLLDEAGPEAGVRWRVAFGA